MFCAVDKIGFLKNWCLTFKTLFVGTTGIYHEDAFSFGDRKLPSISLAHGGHPLQGMGIGGWG